MRKWIVMSLIKTVENNCTYYDSKKTKIVPSSNKEIIKLHPLLSLLLLIYQKLIHKN